MKTTKESNWSYLNAAIIIWAILIFVPVPAFSTETYKFERMWPSLQQPWYFDHASAIAVDNSGFVYIADTDNHRIQKVTSDGQFVTKWGSYGSGDGQFINPSGIATDGKGFVYVADTDNSRIQKFTSDGQFVSQWGEFGSGDGQFKGVRGIAVDNAGYVYTTEYVKDYPEVGNRVQKFTSDGQFVTTWGSYCRETNGSGCIDPDGPGPLAAGDGQFFYPRGIAVDGSGSVYIADLGNHRIQKFTSDGAFMRKWGNYGSADGLFNEPAGITLDNNGNVYVSDSQNYRIQQFTSDGDFVTKWGSKGTGDGQFEWPFHGIAVAGGFVYVSDTSNSRIQKFSLDGQFAAKWAAWGSEDGRFKNPYCIAADGSGFIYIADQDNNRIQKFTADGQFVAKWGSYCKMSDGSGCIDPDAAGPLASGDGQFDGVKGIAVDNAGYVYTTEWNNRRVQKFTSDGQFVTKWGGLLAPYSIAVDSSGFVYVADTYFRYPSIQKFTSEGEFVTKWGSWGTGNGQFVEPFGLAVDSRDPQNTYVYVVDRYYPNRVQKFDSNGGFVTKWGSYCNMDTGNECVDPDAAGPLESGDGQFRYPFGIEVDSDGFVYVVDTRNHRIQKFTPDGLFAGKWGIRGSDPGQFNEPYDMTISPNGLIYVSDTFNYRIQVFRPVSVSSNNKAIIVAGGGPYPGNKLWEATQTAANFAYWTLLYQGFDKNSIYYLTADMQLDLDNNGILDDVDGNATVINLQNAITTWAADADNLFVYLVDHGGSGTFRMSETETLSASEIDTWLDTVQCSGGQGCLTGNVTVIYDACESGSFLSALTPPSGKERIFVSSTASGESSYFVNQGSVSFSNFFWTNVFNGSNVKDAFDNATSALTTAITSQTPQLEDGAGGTLAAATYIGNGTIIYGNVPAIGSVSPPQNISGTATATLTAYNVTDIDGIARVWAVMLPPNYTQSAANNTVNGLPSIDLLPATGSATQYHAVYDKFNLEGTYQIAIYAKDGIGNTSMPMTTTVTVGNPLRKRAIIVAGGSQTDANWSGIQKGAKAAYDALKFQGYSDNDIYFTSPVAFTTGIDGTSTLGNLQYAIETWAADSTHDVVMYMAGSGDSETFNIKGTEPQETLSATQLDGWIDGLQTTITGKVTLIYDASYSGSFNSSLAGPDRILIASSGGEAYFLSDGDISFSNYFWKRILNGQNVRDAFYHARSAMEFSTNYVQTALIDDNGNGTCNERGDGVAAADYTIGAGIRLAGNDPLIGLVSAIPDKLHGGLSTTIRADDVTTVGALAAVDPVWAVVTSPLGPNEESAVQTTVQMSDMGNNRYEGVTGNIFTSSGRYGVTVYAKDDAGNISAVSQTTISQLGLIDMYEEDNTYQQANVIFLNYPFAQQHNFDVIADEDWVKFYGLANTYYTISAANPGGNSDVEFELYDEAGVTAVPQTPIALWGSDVYVYQVAQDGMYYLKVTNAPQTVFGDDTGYDLEVYIEGGGTELPGIIKGYAYASGTAIAIAGANIQTGAGRTAISQANGYYYIGNHNPGTWSMSVSKTGYNPGSGSVSVISLTVTDKNLFMAPTCTSQTWYRDNDADGYGNAAVSVSQCAQPSGYVLNSTDCNDADGSINPDTWWYLDSDGDSYGTASAAMQQCTQPVGFVPDNTDCRDSNANIYPGGPSARVIGAAYYYTLQDAYNAAEDGSTVQSKDVTYGGDLNIYLDKTVTIEGGYDCSFTTVTGETAITGNVTISNGQAEIQDLKLQ